MILDFYNVPVWKSDAEQILLPKIQEELDTAYLNSTFSMKSGWGPTHYISERQFNGSIIDPTMKFFPREIDRHLDMYLEAIQFKQTNFYSLDLEHTIKSCWFSKFEKGNYAHVHDHGSSDISGVYYYKVPDKGSELFFRNPITQMSSSFIYEHLSTSVDVTPEVGTILLFPSWLQHGVKTNESDDTRVSVSFNIQFERT